ncbi:hypothetical protein K503DRAFT_775769 [Rhizopogon vinicolor AM-OR11-026]|uniref:Tc1-like transposase DDE domain-containing protein n=1 Tax=Rhizopogon vinicolor AM-OR11-026 TaxID=1314800 RepID=A0A1B7ML25_9AGAM|nr:hypothetical protein K503DRAFT_775769 [Rhizopogon vinicolor AM-OR11-026]
MSRKKLKHIASEHNEELLAAFIVRMDASEIGFIDDVSRDERTHGRYFGCSTKGNRTHKNQPFVPGSRISLEALLTLDGIVTCTAVEGSMTKELFLEWLEFMIESRASRMAL